MLIESEKVLTILQQRIKAMEYEKKIIHQAPVRHTCHRDYRTWYRSTPHIEWSSTHTLPGRVSSHHHKV